MNKLKLCKKNKDFFEKRTTNSLEEKFHDILTNQYLFFEEVNIFYNTSKIRKNDCYRNRVKSSQQKN